MVTLTVFPLSYIIVTIRTLYAHSFATSSSKIVCKQNEIKYNSRLKFHKIKNVKIYLILPFFFFLVILNDKERYSKENREKNIYILFLVVKFYLHERGGELYGITFFYFLQRN